VLGIDWARIYDVEQPAGNPLLTPPPLMHRYGSDHPAHYQGGMADLTDVVAAGPGLVAVGYLDRGPIAAAWTSADGRSWRLAPGFMPLDATFASAVAAGPAGLVTVGTDHADAAAWTSADGLTWSKVESEAAFHDQGGPLQMTAVAAWAGGWVAGGYLGTYAGPLRAAFWRSMDGRTWARVPDVPAFGDGRVTAIATLGDRLIAVGATGTYHDPTGGVAWTSRDGTTWERAPVSADLSAGVPWSVTAGGPGLVAVGANPDERKAMAWTSLDGTTWTRAPDAQALDNYGLKIRMQDVAVVGDEIIAGGHMLFGQQFSSAVIWHSRDGITWQRTPDYPGFSAGVITGVVAGGPGAVAVGTVGAPDFFIPTAWISPARSAAGAPATYSP